ITGWAALRWRGARFFDGLDDVGRALRVPLVVSAAKIREDDQFSLSQAQLAPSERTLRGGIWVATVQRALFDAMRTCENVRDAVVCMDMAAAAGLISVSLMSRYVERRNAWTGVPLVREALALASDDRRSPPECRLGMFWELDAGLSRPHFNQPLFARTGEFLGIPDLFDEEAGVVGEYAGGDHRDAERQGADVIREHKMRDHGLEYFTVVSRDMQRPWQIVERIHATRARAKFLSPCDRLWTLTPPAWWTSGDTLDTYLVRINEAPFLVRT
ncbi:MAG: hypothetical protein JOZ82_09895, partial [Marmoricola sp.]|nr:hypothetical protein [Marmoricola sp.]